MNNLEKILGRIQSETEKIYIPNYKSSKPFKGYKKIIDNNDIEVFETTNFNKNIIVAAHNATVVTHKKGKKESLYLYPDFRNRNYKYKITFNSKNFPGLLNHSRILTCMIIPYLRETKKDCYFKKWRLVVVTNKCQVFHNFPKRDEDVEGYEKFGDITKFEESVVWDIPNRKYPSKELNCKQFETYIPCLPEACYEYHPEINKKSKFGNDGFSDHKICKDGNVLSRFYFPIRNAKANPFFVMGGYEPDYKMTVVGTYRGNKDIGCRTCLFATSDGGREWYAKYEFADEGVYDFKQGEDSWGFNFGNSFNTKGILSDFNEDCMVQRRLLNHKDKHLFSFDKPISISQIKSGEKIIVETNSEHCYSTGNIVVLKKNTNRKSEWDWIFNNDYSLDSAGNGKFFKIEKIDNFHFFLYECVSNPYNNIACRHIHHINRLRDGWMLGTGEIYPNGWLLYIQMKESDNFSIKNASEPFDIFILNSMPNSVQRTMGADIIDGKDSKLIIASDHDMLHRPTVKINENCSFSRNSTGVYIGNLKDIDDFDKFNIVYEAKEPAYFFKKIQNKYLFGGQRGEMAYSVNPSGPWFSFNLPSPLIHYKGSTYNFHVIDQYLIVFK